jgi:hypothetical protein
MAVRKSPDDPEKPIDGGINANLVALKAENAALARAICHLAVKLPGGNADIGRILQHEVGVSIPDSELIIAAAGRTG